MAIKSSHQSCSSTVAITTCTWDTLKVARPLQVTDYQPYLSFTKGNLEHIPDGAFRLLPLVTVLQLSANKVKTLQEEAFDGLDNLKQLSLYDNRLTTIAQNSLKKCGKLEQLDLGMNKISSVHDKAFEHLNDLEKLNLAFNSLTAVPAAVNSLPNLKILRLDNNAIEFFKAGALSRLNQLKELKINDNKLTRIERDAFKGLISLKKLDLRSNFLVDLSVTDIVEHATDLNEINISINDFTCDKLRKVLADFRKQHVEVARGVSTSSKSVNGITCKPL